MSDLIPSAENITKLQLPLLCPIDQQSEKEAAWITQLLIVYLFSPGIEPLLSSGGISHSINI